MNTIALLSIAIVLVSLAALSGCGGNGVSDPADARVILFQDGFEAYDLGKSLDEVTTTWTIFSGPGTGSYPIVGNTSAITPHSGAKALSLVDIAGGSLRPSAFKSELLPVKAAGASFFLLDPVADRVDSERIKLNGFTKSFVLNFADKAILKDNGPQTTPQFLRNWVPPVGRWYKIEFLVKYKDSTNFVNEIWIDGVLIDSEEVANSSKGSYELIVGLDELSTNPALVGKNFFIDDYEAWVIR